MGRPKKMWQTKKRALVETLLGLQNHKCAKCNRKLARRSKINGSRHRYQRPTLDHVIPKSKGGGNYFLNFVLLCKPCNEAKADTIDPEIVAAAKRIWQPILDLKTARGQRPRRKHAALVYEAITGGAA